ncbi:31992_t:CDS:2, partial [Racocetra persica]
MFAISIFRNEISKRRPLKPLLISSIAFKQVSNLYVGLQFKHWDHDQKLNKNGGVYKYIFECQHAGNPQTKKKTIEPSQQHNRKSIKTNCTCFINICWPLSLPAPSITKLNLTHFGHTLCSDSHFRKGDITDPEQDPENDVSNLLKILRTLKKEDPTWFIAEYFQALMSDKTTSLYIWVLNNLIAATDNSPLLTIFSDCDTGLGS